MIEPSLQSYPLILTIQNQTTEVTAAVSSAIKFLLMAQRFQNSTAKNCIHLGILSTHSCPITMHDRHKSSDFKMWSEKAHA